MNEDLNIIFGEQGEKQLAAAVQHLQTTVNQLTTSLDRMGGELAQSGGALSDAGANAKTASSGFAGLTGAIGSLGIALGAGAIISQVVEFGKASVTAFTNFEQGLADLSSITGLTGKDLENMGSVAREMGVNVEGGATAALKAMEAIGSAKPELLESAAALTQVTKAANVLAQASGDALPQAAQNLTGIMNQFGAGAEQADRFINVLAAGSLEGAANITELAESMKQSGAIASSFNVPVEAAVAALEALADKSIKGGEAGTSLRNFLARMAATEALPKRALEALDKFGVNLDVVSNKALPFQQRLEELAKVSGDTAAIVEIFGIENQAAAQILLNSTKRVEDLTTAVTGTRTAYDQAATRTATFGEQIKRLTRTFDDFKLEIGLALAPYLKELATWLETIAAKGKELWNAMKEVVKPFMQLRDLVSPLADAVDGLNGAVGVSEGQFQFLVKALRIAGDVLTWIVKAVEDVKAAWNGFVEDYPLIAGAIEGITTALGYMINPLSAIGDLWEAVFGDGAEAVGGLADTTKKALSGLASTAMKEFGATAEQVRNFAASFDIAQIKGMEMGDAMEFVKQKFYEFIHPCVEAAKETDDFTKAVAPASGSIAALEAKIKLLNDAFKATGDELKRQAITKELESLNVQLERMQNGPTLDLVKPEAITKIVDFNKELTNSMRTIGEIPKAVDQSQAKLTTYGQLVQTFGQGMADAIVSAVDAAKGAFIDFGAQAAQSIGYAIGAAESVGDAFKAAVRSLLVEIPKLAGMALLNAAAFPANAPIALPLAIAGLALLGLSGLIKGLGDRKQREREQAGASLPEVGTARPSVQGGFGGFMQQMQDQPIVINLSAQMDGTEMGGLFKTVAVMHGKRSIKG